MEGGFAADELFNRGYSYTYDDVIFLLGFVGFPVESVSLFTNLTKNLILTTPCVASPMDTVTDSAMARSVAALGAVGIIHSNSSPSEQPAHVSAAKSHRIPVPSNPVVDGPIPPRCGEAQWDLDPAGIVKFFDEDKEKDNAAIVKDGEFAGLGGREDAERVKGCPRLAGPGSVGKNGEWLKTQTLWLSPSKSTQIRRLSFSPELHSKNVPWAPILFVVACFFLLFSPGKAEGITLQNQCQFSISIFWYGEPSLVLHPDQPNPIGLKPTKETSLLVLSGGSEIKFWACNSVDKPCNAGNNSATVAALSMGNESNSYQASAGGGYNLPLRIKALGPLECAIITCTASLADCPADLQVTDSNGNIIACKLPEDCGESSECLNYWSKLEGSDCLKEEASRCDAGVELVISFCPP